MIKIINKSIADAQATMADNDAYVQHTTPNYRTEFCVDESIETFLETMKTSVIEGTPSQHEVAAQAEIVINQSLSNLGIDIDFDMGMIYTNGRDNCGMPYTKGDSMVMPEGYDFPPGVLSYLNPHLIAHELWHILSRAYPELREAAYRSIGFEKGEQSFQDVENYHCMDLYGLDSFDAIYFVNPDAIDHRFYFRMKDKKVYPCLAKGQHITPVLIYVKDNKIVNFDAVANNGEYNYAFKNVEYNTHPEEICAEHFRMMVMGTTFLPDPDMMASFRLSVTQFFNG